jgi:DHA1 family bicyclomycin/chloramphenicol resistance-like MFS transporter
VTGTNALSTDTYISSLPALQSSLNTSSSVAQLTITAFIAGMALGQLASGPISDARGRRKMILVACVVFTVMAALCAVASTGWLLVAERAVQGFASGSAIAVGRAVVNDSSQGRRAAATFGSLSAVSLIMPVVGPAIGGALVAVGDWRTIFWFLAAVGVAMWASAVVGLPETLPPSRRHPGGFAQLRGRARDLLSDRSFAAPVLVQCLTVGGFLVYIGGSSFVLQQGLGISRAEYTVVFTTNAAAMVVGSALFRLLVMRMGPVPLRRYAITTQTAAVAVLFVAVLASSHHRPPLPAVWVSLAAMTAGLGMFFPANTAIAQQAGRRFSGTASALSGGLPLLVGSMTTPLTGALGSQTVLTMATLMTAFFALAAVSAIWLRQAAPGPDDIDADSAMSDRDKAKSQTISTSFA